MNNIKIAFCIVGLLISNVAFSQLEVGDQPPAYLGKNQAGDDVYLDQLIGKPVIITFWASWCAPCLKEIPMLESVQRHAGKDVLEVIAINFREDRRTYTRTIRRLKEYEMSINYDKRSRVASDYEITAIPHMFMINRQGKIERIHLGYSEEFLPELLEQINALIVDS